MSQQATERDPRIKIFHHGHEETIDSTWSHMCAAQRFLTMLDGCFAMQSEANFHVTNGHILVSRMGYQTGPHLDPEAYADKADQLQQTSIDLAGVFPLRELGSINIALFPCEVCEGSGIVPCGCDCPRCQFQSECWECRGQRKLWTATDGSKRIEYRPVELAPNVYIQDKYNRFLWKFGFREVAQTFKQSGGPMFHARRGDMQIVTMGMSPSAADDPGLLRLEGGSDE